MFVLCVVVAFFCSGWFVILCGFCCLRSVLRRPVFLGRLCSLCVPLGFLLPFPPFLRFPFASLCEVSVDGMVFHVDMIRA
jgi:hypothetical protein